MEKFSKVAVLPDQRALAYLKSFVERTEEEAWQRQRLDEIFAAIKGEMGTSSPKIKKTVNACAFRVPYRKPHYLHLVSVQGA